jgi:D-alanyl-lipoteichoic acid acyltransferase DltB (MBOAT superfamily)
MISLGYIVFLGLITLLYYSLPGKFQRPLLLVASLAFIGSLSVPFLLFAVVFSAINYMFGVWMNALTDAKRRKILYFTSLLINIGVLIFFKYSNFFIDSLNFVLHSFSARETIPLLSVMLPLGISYYTFQCLGYMYRVYKGIEAYEKRIDVFMIYNLFFPKFISGPIEKSNSFLPQLHQRKEWNNDDLSAGLHLLLFGFFKKLAVADTLGLIINQVYGNVFEYSGLTLLMTFLLQPFYIYFDFSGYTDIALGSARLLGFKLTDNFNRPFFAENVSAFWRRWHISLTAWCNEFIFMIVMYKRRKWKNWGSAWAVFLTFLIIGIWHGPRWNFIILGIIQVVAINYEFFTRRSRIRLAKKLPSGLVIRGSRILTFLFFCFSLIYFYAETSAQSTHFISHMFASIDLVHLVSSFRDLVVSAYRRDFFLALAILVIWIVFEAFQERKVDTFGWFRNRSIWVRWPVYYFLIILMLWLAKGENTFVYQQF